MNIDSLQEMIEQDLKLELDEPTIYEIKKNCGRKNTITLHVNYKNDNFDTLILIIELDIKSETIVDIERSCLKRGGSLYPFSPKFSNETIKSMIEYVKE